MTTAPSTDRLPLIPRVDGPCPRRGLGVLSVERESARLELPLARVEIAARVAERVAEVTVEQTFKNPYREALEAVYVFPLAGGAAVSAFEMRVGARVIRGKVQERGEARR